LNDNAWKNFERRVAKVTGGERIPINGRQQLDIKHPYLGIECKHRKSLPNWLFTDAWGQAVEGSKGKDLLPTVVVGERGTSQAFAIVRLETLTELLAMALNEDYVPTKDALIL
tara:strand:- start:117 stop:455 length:339 start_codon:yes stop_codon:yes gene_type:complete